MSAGRRMALSVVVMMATMIGILDTTIANVAMPHMQAALNASRESVAWVLTSYILASAVATPLAGWLEGFMGRRALFTLCTGGFTLASALCGAAPTLPAMVAARVLQGLFGALLMPLSQAVLLDVYPLEKRAQAITIWSMGTMLGPILGPIIGGWLTDSFNWRWVFYVNVPFGIVSTVALWFLMPRGRAASRRFDLFGFALLATAFSALQLLLDRGTMLDWFDSTEIVIEAGVTIATLWMFAIHTLTARNPIIPRELFADRNFMSAIGLTLIVFGIGYSSQALLAPMLQQLMHYDTQQAGMLLMPRGIGTTLAILVSGRLVNRVDPRITVAGGISLLVLAQLLMSHFDLVMGHREMIVAGFLQGAGNGLVVMPLTMIVFVTLAPALRTDAAAVTSLIRNLAGSIGIAIGGAFTARSLQVAHAEIGEHVTMERMPLLDSRLIDQLGHAGGTMTAMIDAEVNRQALMVAYLNDFKAMMWAALLILPLIIFFRPPRGGQADTPPVIVE